MTNNKVKFLVLLFFFVGLIGGARDIWAVIVPEKSSNYMVKSLTELRPSLTLSVSDATEVVKMNLSKMRARVVRSIKDETIEPLYLPFKTKVDFDRIASKFAKPGRVKPLISYMRSNVNNAVRLRPDSQRKMIPVTKEAFKLIDKSVYANATKTVHHNLSLKAHRLKSNPNKMKKLLKQVKSYLSSKEIRRIKEKIKRGVDVDIDSDLLPKFAKQMVRRFTIFRGPNCFHAAVAFQGQGFTDSSLLNVKREKGYHKAMINYDELWRILQTKFYEVNTSKARLKYGDVLVFFDKPKGVGDLPYFKWIRHASVYLFDKYTFSKGSKSPNTPYTVKTLEEEWKTWKKYTKNMGVKVFRRSFESAKSVSPIELNDWMY